MKKAAILTALLVAVTASAQTYDVRVDTQYPERDLADLTMLQGANPSMRVYVRQNGGTYTNISGHTATFYGGPSATSAAFVVRANASVTPASGYFTLNFQTTDTATNTTAGAWWYTILLRDAGDRIYYSGSGEWNITASTAAGSPSTLDLSTPLDWSGYTYSSTATGGPYRAGSNVTFSALAGGAVAINGSAGSDTTNSQAYVESVAGALDNAYSNYVNSTYLNLSGNTMTGPLSMGGFPILSVASAVTPTNAVNLGQVNALLAAYLPLAGGTMTGPLTVGDGIGSGISPQASADDIVIDSSSLNAGMTIASTNGGNASVVFCTGDHGNNAASLQYISSVNRVRVRIANVTKLEATTNGVILYQQPTTTNIANGVNEVVNYQAMTNANAAYLPLAGGTMTGGLAMGANNVTGTGNNTASTYTASSELITPTVRATGAAGLRLEDDGDNLGLFIADGGKVGIGTNAPGNQLTVHSGTADGVAKFESADGNAWISFSDPDTSAGVQVGADADDFSVRLGGTKRMTIDSSGYVAIGGTPQSGFDLYCANNGNVWIDGASNAELRLDKGSNTRLASVAYLNAGSFKWRVGMPDEDWAQADPDSYGVFPTLLPDNQIVARLLVDRNTDNIGIMTNVPQERLHVAWSAGVDAGFFRGTTDTDITGTFSRSPDGTLWYTYVSDAGTNIITTTKP